MFRPMVGPNHPGARYTMHLICLTPIYDNKSEVGHVCIYVYIAVSRLFRFFFLMSKGPLDEAAMGPNIGSSLGPVWSHYGPKMCP
jgi:hypothetical protein